MNDSLYHEPPLDAEPGQLWRDPRSGKLFVRYHSPGGNAAWVEYAAGHPELYAQVEQRADSAMRAEALRMLEAAREDIERAAMEACRKALDEACAEALAAAEEQCRATRASELAKQRQEPKWQGKVRAILSEWRPGGKDWRTQSNGQAIQRIRTELSKLSADELAKIKPVPATREAIRNFVRHERREGRQRSLPSGRQRSLP